MALDKFQSSSFALMKNSIFKQINDASIEMVSSYMLNTESNSYGNMNSVHLILILFLFVSCDRNNSSNKKNIASHSIKSDRIKHQLAINSNNINQRDKNNLKQGTWQVIKNGKIKGFETYKNDTLNGIYSYWLNYPGQYHTGNYSNGKKNGFLKIYEDSSLTAIVKYNKGTQEYMGFLGDSQYPKPIKGFGMTLDSILVNCPYDNDTIWYSGLFLHKKPVGIHKTYFPNGQLKFEYDYQTLKIKAFDKNGKLIYTKKDDGKSIQ